MLSYALEIDYDLSGNFVQLIGHEVDQMALSYTVSGLIKGTTYGFRYRAKNTYGWSDYSPNSFLLVAIEPGVAAKPQFVSADDDNI